MSLALPRLGADWGQPFFMPQLLPTDGRSVKAGDQNEKPRCLVAAPVLAGRTQITALGTKPGLSLVACVFLVLAVPVARGPSTKRCSAPKRCGEFRFRSPEMRRLLRDYVRVSFMLFAKR